MKAFTIYRSKIREITAFATRSEAVAALDGEVGYVVIGDVVHHVKKTLLPDGERSLLRSMTTDQTWHHYSSRTLFATPKKAWAAHVKRLRAEAKDTAREYKADQAKRLQRIKRGPQKAVVL